jgi:hypothetical protein
VLKYGYIELMWIPYQINFLGILGEARLIDVAPVKLGPTRKNTTVGQERVAKRLDKFLIDEKISNDHLRITQWIGIGGDSNHFQSFLSLNLVEQIQQTPQIQL